MFPSLIQASTPVLIYTIISGDLYILGTHHLCCPTIDVELILSERVSLGW